jgi:hypothetical protein
MSELEPQQNEIPEIPPIPERQPRWLNRVLNSAADRLDRRLLVFTAKPRLTSNEMLFLSEREQQEMLDHRANIKMALLCTAGVQIMAAREIVVLAAKITGGRRLSTPNQPGEPL